MPRYMFLSLREQRYSNYLNCQIMKTEILKSILNIVTSVCEIPQEQILSKCKRNDIVDARCIFVHFAVRKYGFKSAYISAFLGRKRTKFVNDCLNNYDNFFEQSMSFRLMCHDVQRMLSPSDAASGR